MRQVTRITNRDAEMIEKRIAREVKALGDPPTLESLRAMGYSETHWLNFILDGIQAFGRILTLMVAEAIQSGAALILLFVFGQLEFWRVYHGAMALGQAHQQAALIALAVVVANVVHPIFSLRAVRGQEQYQVTSLTLRGWIEIAGRRLFGKPQVKSVPWSHNPTLKLSALVLTWVTLALAVYDLISPLISSIATGTTTKPNIILVAELLMGLGLSFSGVFFLQSTAHDIGARIMQDQPSRLSDVLTDKCDERERREEAIRQRVTDEYMEGKIADATRTAQASRKDGTDASVRPLAINRRDTDV